MNGLSFKPLYNVVYTDEKWFYRTRMNQKYYLANDERPQRSVKSSRMLYKRTYRMTRTQLSAWGGNGSKQAQPNQQSPTWRGLTTDSRQVELLLMVRPMTGVAAWAYLVRMRPTTTDNRHQEWSCLLYKNTVSSPMDFILFLSWKYITPLRRNWCQILGPQWNYGMVYCTCVIRTTAHGRANLQFSTVSKMRDHESRTLNHLLGSSSNNILDVWVFPPPAEAKGVRTRAVTSAFCFLY